jgi:hypothetical protein
MYGSRSYRINKSNLWRKHTQHPTQTATSLIQHQFFNWAGPMHEFNKSFLHIVHKVAGNITSLRDPRKDLWYHTLLLPLVWAAATSETHWTLAFPLSFSHFLTPLRHLASRRRGGRWGRWARRQRRFRRGTPVTTTTRTPGTCWSSTPTHPLLPAQSR